MPDPHPERDPFEVLASDFTERLRRGQRPSIDAYAAQHPGLAREIRELFPTIAATERLKARHSRSSDGRATLGAARLERLGDFRLLREIGRGGMGVVFEAEQESLGRRVAVKVLPRQALLDEKQLKRFEREARIAAQLHHTNIVEIFGVGEQDGFHYYVMQHICGVGLDALVPMLAELERAPPARTPPPSAATAGSAASDRTLAEPVLRQLLGGEAGLPRDGRVDRPYWQAVARIGLQAAEALGYAHQMGTLHRDIKPANLLLDAQGTVWLADFGLAKAAQSDDVTLTGDAVGTLRYMPPEQLRGVSDQRSDIYSLGLTLYELLALRPAFAEANPTRLIQQITHGAPEPPSRSLPAVPRDLETIVLKACNPEPGHRYPTAAAMANDLRCFLEDRPIRARPVSPAERLARWCRRNKSLAGLTGTTLLLLCLVATVASIGYVRTRSALRGEARERARAETNAGLAAEVLGRIFDQIAPARMQLGPELAVPGTGEEAAPAPAAPLLSKGAAALLEEMLPFYDRLAGQTGSDDALRARTAQANRRVGAIRQRLGQFEQAARAYGRALALYREPRTGPLSATTPHLEIAQIQNELGRIHTAQQQPAQAREAHLAALALLSAADTSPSASAAAQFELARTCYFLGTQERPLPSAGPRRGMARPSQAEKEDREQLAKAVALLTALAAAHPANPEYPHLLALCYLEGARVQSQGVAEPKEGAGRAIEILEGLVRSSPDVPDYAYDLGEAYARIHIPRPPIPPELQRTIADRFGKALAVFERLAAQHPDIPDFQAAEARMHDRLGSFARQLEHWSEAEQHFRKAISIQTAKASEWPKAPAHGLWMASFRIALADALLRQNRAAEARVELEDTIATLQRQLAVWSPRPAPHDLLALGYDRLATALRQVGERNRADAAARSADRERNAVQGP